MTTERLDTVSLGSCPTCGGPAQFVDGPCGNTGCAHLASNHMAFNGCGSCACSWDGIVHSDSDYVREVRLPNIDEDLGGGWRLTGIDRMLQVLAPERTWRTEAEGPGRHGNRLSDVEYGWGDSPSTAYLALRTAIEARR